jgi:hypothetical protein
MSELHADDARIALADFRVEQAALVAGGFTGEEIAAMRRHVKLAEELRGCRYFTQEERSLSGTVEAAVTTSWKMNLPERGATRDMLTLLRQLFSRKERSSFDSMVGLLQRHADTASPPGRQLREALATFEKAKQGVLDSWDAQPEGTEVSPQPPLTVFLDWMYGEYLHSDAEKAERIEQLDTPFRLYEWQFHWVAERLAVLFASFARLVDSALATAWGDPA